MTRALRALVVLLAEGTTPADVAVQLDSHVHASLESVDVYLLEACAAHGVVSNTLQHGLECHAHDARHNAALGELRLAQFAGTVEECSHLGINCPCHGEHTNTQGDAIIGV